jgi:hypothetical protein
VKYRKKPVVIEARLVTAESRLDVRDWIRVEGGDAWTWTVPGLVIRTSEGDMRADLGDYVVQGVKGEFYPCKPDIFHMTYEPVGLVSEDF